MGNLDWNRAKQKRPSASIYDEKDSRSRDEAAKWLLQNETPKKVKNRKNSRAAAKRVDRRQSPQDQRSGMVIYTDGACEPNPGKGGWGFVVYEAGVEIFSECGGEPETTNNAMEMTGVIKALGWMQSQGVKATLISDSQYVVKGCNEWRHSWKARGWRRVADGTKRLEPIKNGELWREIDALLTATKATIEWCKGHAGIAGNERADQLSNQGRKAAMEMAKKNRSIERQLTYSI